jgi:hypothetical protein
MNYFWVKLGLNQLTIKNLAVIRPFHQTNNRYKVPNLVL